jgi:DNA-binding NtrC family response regulator
MHRVGIPARTEVLAPTTVEDEDVAAHSASRLLISGASRQGVETLARRIHGAGRRAPFPFLQQQASHLPIEAATLRAHCARVLDAAAGGSMLISDVEDLPPVVQGMLIELLAELESASCRSPAVRLISGTTVALFDRVLAGTFSAPLFYRLNIIHLVAGDRAHDIEWV